MRNDMTELLMHFDGGTHEGNWSNESGYDNGIGGYLYWGWIMKPSPCDTVNDTVHGRIHNHKNGLNHNYETNNEAEYMALIQFLKWFESHMYEKVGSIAQSEIMIKGDSKLILEQVFGSWKVKAENLKPLNKVAKELIKSIEVSGINIRWEHSPRSRPGQVEVDAYARDMTVGNSYCGIQGKCFCPTREEAINF